MSSRSIRLLKEGRALFWPWCAVMLAAAVDLVRFSVNPADRALPASVLGFWVGFPVIAALSLGNEFQYRTLPLMLSQPISRRTLWLGR